jgi:hypothetical protein
MASFEAVIRKVVGRITSLEAYVNQRFAEVAELTKHAKSLNEEIGSIPGRRIFYSLVGSLTFTAAQAGTLGNPIQFLVSQDGPFVGTHYPLVCWKPSAPAGATNFGRWSPVTSWPLPTQQVGANQDSIDLSYQVADGGSQRNFQNATVPPLFSRPDNVVLLPMQTLWSPNSQIQFVPTFEDINFAAGAATPTTGGTLVVAFPGYRIANL